MAESGSIREELLAAEHRGWRSLCEGTGDAFYGAIMTADGEMVLAGGFALDRDGVIASLRDAPRWESYSISGERLISLSEGTWALVYVGCASRGPDVEFRALMSSTYVHLNGEWRLALYQQTPIES
ncbi:nuclear transport factor 2 family protein [Microbacterium sp. MPKO10]|uniref:nuclear transport factor 2 family protein n=1 Tax=Microbacterium sp. MPKO10 TaxID=2989818 RepID=UPI002236A703|nr:nuclear transport factor 2 family protein [Microbacterium sp. MPKO10]MCW4459145.1 DUF4440 domain-containing protein [Microbacterium sp. MPKO10]